MAKAKETSAQPSQSKGLQQAVAREVKSAEKTASTGNVATVKETTAQPTEALFHRGHPAE